MTEPENPAEPGLKSEIEAFKERRSRRRTEADEPVQQFGDGLT